MSNNILIKQGDGQIIVDGEHLISEFNLFGAEATGQSAVYIDGTFGPATVSLGWISRGVFYLHDLPDGSPAAFTDFTAQQMGSGTDNRLAIKVVGMTGTTDILITATPIKG